MGYKYRGNMPLSKDPEVLGTIKELKARLDGLSDDEYVDVTEFVIPAASSELEADITVVRHRRKKERQ